MVARPGPRKSSCNAGELISDIAGRPDIKQYYSGGLRFKHVEPVPQSGFRLMSGTDDMGPVRAGLVAVAITGTTDTLGPHSSEATVREITFASAVIDGVEVAGLASDAGDFTFTLDLWDGSQWVEIAADMDGSATAVTRFAAFAPGEGITATKARVRVTPSASQSFVLTGLTPYAATGDLEAPRYARLPVDKDTGYFIAVGNGFADIWNKTTWIAAVLLPDVTAARLPALGFYGELYTVGLFHEDIETVRIRRSGSDHEWTVDDWPYSGIPAHDYGDTYTTVDDVWEAFFRWSTTVNPECAVQITINGESTPTVYHKSGGSPIQLNSSNTTTWQAFADELADAINDLPSMPGGVTALGVDVSGSGTYKIVFTFEGASSGAEYGFDILIVNTTDAAVLPGHTAFGDPGGEDLLSTSRGWPADTALVQDRLVYYGLKSEQSALLWSQAAEYFTINTKAQLDSAARLDRPRGTGTSEEVLHVKEAIYTLVFTNIGVYFINNRVINRNDPLNFISASEVGIQPYTQAIELEQNVYYVSSESEDEEGGNEYPGQIYSLAYDEVKTNFTAIPESLLAAHLVSGIVRTARQKPVGERDTAKMWMLRADGRLVCAKVIRSQDILGMVEWLSAGATLKEMAVDHFNRPWVAAQRGAAMRHERFNPDSLFRQTVVTTTDLAGAVSDLPFPDGAEVWCDADGYIRGPFTVASGGIDLGEAFTTVQVGYWTAPIFEDMPHVLVTPQDEIVERPGRINKVYCNLRDTTSIAIGANNTDPEDVSLITENQPTDTALAPYTGPAIRNGILGHKTGTTVVITQVKPGKLQVRDYHVEERL